MEKIRILHFDGFFDERGLLVPFETSEKNIPFDIKRVFYLKNLNDKERGFHAHKNFDEIIIPISGNFEVEITDSKEKRKYKLDDCRKGLFIPNMLWFTLKNFSKDCVILALCSKKYDEKDYIRNYDDFVKKRNKRQIKEINFFSLEKQTKLLKTTIMNRIENVIDTNDFVLGKELEEFEKNFAIYNGCKYCVGVSNGTSALIAGLLSLEFQKNDKVAIQANTYIAGPLAISHCGLGIEIIDVDVNLNIDLDDLERKLINEKIKAVILVHMYGMCPDMDKIMELKEKYSFKLIEDCAQAHGSTYRGKKLGTFGEVGCFSFYPSKNLGSFGEGGCIITNSIKICNFVNNYRNYGSMQKYQWEIKGTNDRMHNIQAAVLNVKLTHLNEWNNKKREKVKIYDYKLANIREITILKNNKFLNRGYHLYVVLAEKRDELLNFLKQQGIYCGIHYPIPFYKSFAFKELNAKNTTFDEYCKKIVSLPLYPEIENEDLIKVCEKIEDFYQKKKKYDKSKKILF